MDEAEIKQQVTTRVRNIADKIDWLHLRGFERQKYYEEWTNDPEIGGQLRIVMKPIKVRVYLKDTVMKVYARDKLPKVRDLLVAFSFTYSEVTGNFIKPIGLLCDDQDLFTLATAREWKIAIMSAFERGYNVKALRRNIVFFTDHTVGRYVDDCFRKMIELAANHLGIEVFWVI